MKTLLRNRLFDAVFFAVFLFLIVRARVASADDAQGVSALDQTLTHAITRGDKAAVSRLLTDNFEFTNVEGQTFNKLQTLELLASISTAGPDVVDVHSSNYGELAYSIGVHRNIRFLHVWVKQLAAWRLFIYLETPIAARAPVAPGGGNCDNPCRTIPYVPATKMDQAIIESWQKAKIDEWHPNADDWALHIADEFLMINARTERPKSERVVLIAKQQENHELGPPGDPVRSIRMFDVGSNSAVMLSFHSPYHGGKLYYNVRIWVLRDARWQLAMSQQTTIRSATPVAGVN